MTPPPFSDAHKVAMRMNDFPAGLSPMLVKELRQGMRTSLFAVAFILFQTLMILSLITGLADPGAPQVDAFFWFFVVVTLLFVQPLRGFNALSSEYQLNTMDLIQLTRLNGWRITLGKWTALNAQTLLFLTGVLPYLVMRYFLGNVNFVVDLASLAMLGLGSGLASAITIGCSVFRNLLLRGLVLAGLGFGFIVIFGVVQFNLFRSGMGGRDFWSLALVALSMLYGCFFFLSFGASRIAPLSENHATRKRLVAIVFTLITLSFTWIGNKEFVVVVAGIILGLACIDALTEPLPVFSRVLEPFRKNPLTRFAAGFFAPGWISGIGFFYLAGALWATTLYCNGFFDTAAAPADPGYQMWTIFLSMCNVLVFPLLIIHLFFAKLTSGHFTFALYAFIQGFAGLATIMIMALAAALSRYEEIIYMVAPLPSVLIAAAERGEATEFLYFVIALSTTLLCVGIPLLRNRAAFRSFQHHLKPS